MKEIEEIITKGIEKGLPITSHMHMYSYNGPWQLYGYTKRVFYTMEERIGWGIEWEFMELYHETDK